LDAVGLADRVRLLLAAAGFAPVVERNGADVDAYTISSADIPVYGNVGSVNAQFAVFGGSPNFVSIVFACNLSVGLKIRVYRQKIHQF
jgi:hypothetical protein